jgi:hypothetical protein
MCFYRLRTNDYTNTRWIKRIIIVDILRDNERLYRYEIYRIEWMHLYRLRTIIRTQDEWNRRVEWMYFYRLRTND